VNTDVSEVQADEPMFTRETARRAKKKDSKIMVYNAFMD